MEWHERTDLSAMAMELYKAKQMDRSDITIYICQYTIPHVDSRLQFELETIALAASTGDYGVVDTMIRRLIQQDDVDPIMMEVRESLTINFRLYQTPFVVPEIIAVSLLPRYAAVGEWDKKVAVLRAQAIDTLREIYPPPYALGIPTTDKAELLARHILANNRFEDMPVLCQMLKDAGATDPSILFHCQTQKHSKYCWLLKKLTSKKMFP